MYSTGLERLARLLPLLCAACVFAADLPTNSTPEHSTDAKAFIDERLALWQKRLKLEDWRLTATLVRASELKPGTLGNIRWDTPSKTAAIKVLCPEDYKLAFPQALRDMEFTVVHELVHLQLSVLPRSEASRGAEERTVNQLTQALLDLARKD